MTQEFRLTIDLTGSFENDSLQLAGIGDPALLGKQARYSLCAALSRFND